MPHDVLMTIIRNDLGETPDLAQLKVQDTHGDILTLQFWGDGDIVFDIEEAGQVIVRPDEARAIASAIAEWLWRTR